MGPSCCSHCQWGGAPVPNVSCAKEPLWELLLCRGDHPSRCLLLKQGVASALNPTPGWCLLTWRMLGPAIVLAVAQVLLLLLVFLLTFKWRWIACPIAKQKLHTFQSLVTMKKSCLLLVLVGRSECNSRHTVDSNPHCVPSF